MGFVFAGTDVVIHPSAKDRLPHRRNHRDALSARRRRSCRRHLRLHGASARGAQKPKVSSFLHARYEKIEALKPDLILAFSDLQADITNDLVKRGYPVFTFNQRSVAEILQMIRVLAGIVGVPRKAKALGAHVRARSRCDSRARGGAAPPSERSFRGMGRPADQRHSLDRGAGRDRRRRSDLSRARARRAREGSHRHERAGDRRAPDVIIGSWCGKPVRKERIAARPGWQDVPAVKNGQIYEVKSTYILQPGPAALTEGVTQLHDIIRRAGYNGDDQIAIVLSLTALAAACGPPRPGVLARPVRQCLGRRERPRDHPRRRREGVSPRRLRRIRRRRRKRPTRRS